MTKTDKTTVAAESAGRAKMSPAERALAEAEARRAALDAERNKLEAVPEIGGPNGPDPARYGDWEKNGIAKDF